MSYIENTGTEQGNDKFISAVPFITVTPYHGEQHHTVNATRGYIKSALPFFNHLRVHLHAGMQIFDKFPAKVLEKARFCPSSRDFDADENGIKSDFEFSELAKHQFSLMYHHCAISETLQRNTTRGLGIPLHDEWAVARNVFSHHTLGPNGRSQWAGLVMKARGNHERLFRQVGSTVTLLKQHLADPSVWYQPADESREEDSSDSSGSGSEEAGSGAGDGQESELKPE